MEWPAHPPLEGGGGVSLRAYDTLSLVHIIIYMIDPIDEA